VNSPNNGSRNRLLAVLSHADRDLLAPRLEVIELDPRQILEVPSDPIGHVYFVESGLVSVVGTTQPDHRIEVGMVGYEGMTGLCIVLGDLLSGGLGGLLGGAAAGSVLSGGLGNLIKEFQDSGHGHAADSWVGTGPNKEIAPNDLADALGSDTLDTLSQRTGMAQNDLLEALRHQLPGFVDQLTPHGRIPTEEEASRMV